MTTTTARKAGSPRTVQQLEAELERHEHNLMEAQRANTVARSALGGHIADADAEAIAECRREMAATAAKVKEITESLEATQDAIGFAKARIRAAADTQAYGRLKKLTGDCRAEVDALADSITAFANALKAVQAGLASLDAQMVRDRVTPDPLILRAKLLGIVELALHVETDGMLVPLRTLQNREELRRSGQASLQRAAEEFHVLTMRKISNSLNVTRE